MSAILPTATADLRARLLAQPDLTDADRAALVQLFDQQRRYGLAWEDKPEAVEEILREFLPVLEEVPARALLAPAPGAPQHTLIEGDNLHALTVLSYTHAAQVDFIYIDPPYNTGKKDFIYNDRFVDREDGYRHSKWLSFMAKRLKMAKALLKETGVIFISIDDNEQAALRMLCDEVMGEGNFVAKFVWRTDGNFDNQAQIKICHEYIYCYANNINLFKVSSIIDPNTPLESKLFKDEIKNTIVKNGSKNPVSKVFLPAGFPALFDSGSIKKQNTKYPYYHANVEIIDFETQGDVVVESGWASKGQLEQFIGGHFSPIVDSKGQETIFALSKTGSIEAIKLRANQSHILSILSNLGNTQSTSAMLKKMGIDFSFPKPVGLIKYLISLGVNKSATILDFFAGSGTTLHATMALNAEDGGTRRCILVTNNENNICEQVTYKRNRHVIQGYTTPKGVVVPGLSGNSLRYYRCVAPVPRTPTPRHKRELVRRATDLLCLKEDCYTPLPGVPAGSDFVGFGNSCAATVIVYDDSAVEDAVAFVAALPVPAAARVGRPWCAVYVFAAGSYPYEDEFADIADRVRLSALPEALYRAWQQLLPPQGVARPIEEPDPATALAVPVIPAEAAVPSETTTELTAEAVPLEADLAVVAPKTDKRGNLHLS